MSVTLRQFVSRSPVWLVVACVVLCSVAASVAAMLVLGHALNMSREWMYGRALVIAVVVPALVSLPVSLVIVRLLHEAEAAREAAQRLAWCDELTGSLNRRRFGEMVRRELIGAERSHRPLTVALLDIDDFKQINDQHGHAAGDAVLCAVATTIKTALRATDLSARWGGEEFAIAMPDTDIDQAMAVSQRVRKAIGALREGTLAGKLVACTVSVGVAARGRDAQTLEALFNRADGAMYLAKQAGKDRVVLADAGSDGG